MVNIKLMVNIIQDHYHYHHVHDQLIVIIIIIIRIITITMSFIIIISSHKSWYSRMKGRNYWGLCCK